MKQRVIGVDPGLQHTGWGILDTEGNRISFVACGTIHTKSTAPLPHRLVQLHQELTTAIEQHHPTVCAIEETFVNRNPLSSLKLGHARGALLTTVSLAGLPISEYAATKVKKSVVGVGRAEKEQVEHMVKMLLPGASPDSADSADALAVAICHAHHASMASMVSG